MTGVSVEVCVPSRDGRLSLDLMGRLDRACRWAAQQGIACESAQAVDRYSVAACRNRGVAGFLGRRSSHLLFVDDDVALPERAIAQLAETAAQHSGDVVAGCVPSVRIDETGEVIAYVQVQPPCAGWLKTWPEALLEAELVGGGCMMIPRELFSRIEFPWFRWPERLTGGGVRAQTDDADFCLRARAAGARVWADSRVRCGHHKLVDVARLIGLL